MTAAQHSTRHATYMSAAAAAVVFVCGSSSGFVAQLPSWVLLLLLLVVPCSYPNE
jgi:hypothetical protein